MTQPVISSRFGRRPILEVPAMSTGNRGFIEVGSIEGPNPGYHHNVPAPIAQNPMLGPGVYTGMPSTVPAPVNWPHPGYDGRYNTAPNYYPYERYPGVGNPYGHTYPQPMQRVVSDPSFGPHHPGFNIICDLEYGRIVNINVRDSEGAFRGIPPFLRDELVRTYGRYPYTEVKIRMEGGEFHIFASTHNKLKLQKRRFRHAAAEEDDDGDTYYEAHSDRFRQMREDYDDEESEGIRPRDRYARPRGITHEDGWDTYR